MKQRTLLVTGGNRGIGLAIVKELSKSSDDTVLLGCRNLEEGEKIAKEVGENVHAVSLDVSDRDKLNTAISSILEKYNSIDVLINNAGILNEGSFDEVDIEKFDESLRINTLGPYDLIRAVIGKMKENQYGRIVNISSEWGSFNDGLCGPFSYSVSKAALNALTMTIAKGLPENIKINSMCPGWVRTRMGGEMATRSPEQGAQTALWLANLDKDGPSGGFFRDKAPIKW